MQLVVVPKSLDNSQDASESLLRLAFSCLPLREMVVDGISECCDMRPDDLAVALPGDWKRDGDAEDPRLLRYDGQIPVDIGVKSRRGKSWFVISDGRFLARADTVLLCETVKQLHCDVVAVTVEPHLQAGMERVLTDSNHNLVGFRLLYADTVRRVPLPPDWPHHLFISPDVLSRVFDEAVLPGTFGEFVNNCLSKSVKLGSIEIGGTLLDLNTEKGLLSLVSAGLAERDGRRRRTGRQADYSDVDIAPNVKLFGEVFFGRNINVGPDTIIAGPAVIGEGVQIAERAVIRSCIIAPGVVVPPGSIIECRVIRDTRQISQSLSMETKKCPDTVSRPESFGKLSGRGCFRVWPRISYARCIKRIADVIAAAVVLVIFAPVLPVIAVAVKLSSRGPVFFKDIRQGLHGRPFACLKFRTMSVGADELQEKLRGLNEADGPQFTMSDDPRLSKVGRFLRETYLDEIPQFFAVLLGRMSLVGPRPSPESENILCPFWRDARLSVKPGITGLWQVCRTRQPMRDFQEWIHYDIEYVRNLSMTLDLWICWQTVRKMVANFIRQF